MHVEALDAQDAWPPFLRPGVLAGHDAFTRWESQVLSALSPVAEGQGAVGPTLASALCWTDELRQWRPVDGAFFVTVGKPLRQRDVQWLLRWVPTNRVSSDVFLLNSLIKWVPQPWQPSSWPAGLTDASMDGPPVARTTAEAALARYLGTRLHGSWVAYQGEGLRAVLASLVSVYGLTTRALRDTGRGVVTLGRLTTAIRATDWLLLHLLDRDKWAAWCSQWEREADSRPLIALVANAAQGLDELTWA